MNKDELLLKVDAFSTKKTLIVGAVIGFVVGFVLGALIF